MGRLNKKIIYLWMAVFITQAVLGACGSKFVVQGKDKNVRNEQDGNFQTAEKAYRGDVKEALVLRGLPNSGVTMTKVMEGDNRVYMVLIYHKGLERLSDDERAELLAELSAISFAAPGCRILHEFLKNDF